MMSASKIRSLYIGLNRATGRAFSGRTVIVDMPIALPSSARKRTGKVIKVQKDASFTVVESAPMSCAVQTRPEADMNAIHKGRLRGHRSGRNRNRY